MKLRYTLMILALCVTALAAGAVGAFSGRSSELPVAPAVVVAGGISYQGQLTDANGKPLEGTVPVRFVIYDDDAAGSAVWDSGTMEIDVENGLFSVTLDAGQEIFDGQALWLNIIVNGESLSPRQEILPAPYALSLRPGASMVGDMIGAAEAILTGRAPATGTAFHADANGGAGVFSESEASYGVYGASSDSWGGYFTSQGGYGLRVDTQGTDHYDHGAYVTADSGYGVYAQSAMNQGLRGEAGDVNGIPQPLGAVGVVGIGQNRGVYGSSLAGTGLYGSSDSNYAIWGQSTNYRGVTGRTDRTDSNYGLYTPDNLYSANFHLAGAVMQVMQNGGSAELSPGDVVVFSGINATPNGLDGPIARVSSTDAAHSPAVAGVVYSRFNIDAMDPALEAPDDSLADRSAASMEVTPPGNAAPGEYVLVIVQGLAEVRTSDLATGDIQPGDLLSTADAPGLATRATTVDVNGVKTAVPGTVFAKALETSTGNRDTIYVYVTLQ